jgi:hypothetical protein
MPYTSEFVHFHLQPKKPLGIEETPKIISPIPHRVVRFTTIVQTQALQDC